MHDRSTILCPIDFSPASAGALRCAAAVAEARGARLLVLTVADPLLTEALDLGTGVAWSPDDCAHEIEEFVRETLGAESPNPGVTLEYKVAVGKCSGEILRVAREQSCELIVISTHGLSGFRKLFFGSTTERVLRETTIPVLVTPPLDPGPLSVKDAKRMVRRILVPVDLTVASLHQTRVARELSEALAVPLILVHVVESVKSRLAARLHMDGVEANRRAVAEEALQELLATLPPQVHPEALVAYGDTAEELAKVAHDRDAGLIVMGLHGSPLLGPHMGSVTYRLLCLASALVLALPPAGAAARSVDTSRERSASDTPPGTSFGRT
jgi:nucleotide-binding universal stress UspA family protein